MPRIAVEFARSRLDRFPWKFTLVSRRVYGPPATPDKQRNSRLLLQGLISPELVHGTLDINSVLPLESMCLGHKKMDFQGKTLLFGVPCGGVAAAPLHELTSRQRHG